MVALDVRPAPAQLAPAPASREYRVSALIQGARGYLVGFVDVANAQSFYVPEHGTGRGITVVEVDYEAERILLKVGDETRELFLADAPETRIVQVNATAAEENVDLIIIGTHGHTGIEHVLFGTTAEKVVRKAPCPVLVLRGSYGG